MGTSPCDGRHSAAAAALLEAAPEEVMAVDSVSSVVVNGSCVSPDPDKALLSLEYIEVSVAAAAAAALGPPSCTSGAVTLPAKSKASRTSPAAMPDGKVLPAGLEGIVKSCAAAAAPEAELACSGGLG